jgi:hypothetical protein
MRHLALVLLLAACEDDVALRCAEGADCSTGDVWACSPGVLVATETGCECVGESFPLPETCNGLDDDCDGAVDNVLYRDIPDDCYETEVGVCRFAQQACLHGQWRCIPPPSYGSEECDGFDNDCDGAVDEGLETQYFYGAEQATMGVGECRPGFSNCRAGAWETTADVVPRSEVCGDGRDNDCDGLVDEREDGVSANAFALVIDVSGSMAENISAVTQGVCDWAFGAPPTDVIAAVLVSRGTFGSEDADAGTEVYFDFVDPSSACFALGALPADGYTEEYQLEGLRSTTELSWPDDYSRTAIVFTDEPLHVLLGPEWMSLADVPALCTDYDLRVYSMTDPLTPWDQVASECNGEALPLPSDSSQVTTVLVHWFSGSCL